MLAISSSYNLSQPYLILLNKETAYKYLTYAMLFIVLQSILYMWLNFMCSFQLVIPIRYPYLLQAVKMVTLIHRIVILYARFALFSLSFLPSLVGATAFVWSAYLL